MIHQPIVPSKPGFAHAQDLEARSMTCVTICAETEFSGKVMSCFQAAGWTCPRQAWNRERERMRMCGRAYDGAVVMWKNVCPTDSKLQPPWPHVDLNERDPSPFLS